MNLDNVAAVTARCDAKERILFNNSKSLLQINRLSRTIGGSGVNVTQFVRNQKVENVEQLHSLKNV